MENFIIALIIIAIVGGAIAKIIVEKRKGAKCIGCPLSTSCSRETSHSSCNSYNCDSNKGR